MLEIKLAERISKDLKLEYIKVYIFFFEVFRFLKYKAYGGFYTSFPGFFHMFPAQETRLSVMIMKHIRANDINAINSFIIDLSFSRAAFLRTNMISKYASGAYRTRYRKIYPLEFEEKAYWRTDKANKFSKRLDPIYKKFKLSLYKRVVINTQDEYDMLAYCEHYFNKLMQLPLIQEKLHYSNIPTPTFKLDIKRDKII